MGAKDIVVKPISSKDAIECVKKYHYSGKVAQNSQLHLGVFLNGRLNGVMQFGPSLDKSKIIGLVSGTKWNDFLELNRMAFGPLLPKNSESRALSIAFKLIKKHYPNIEWIISFADGTQCGDGTIYRATGFSLTAINESFNLAKLPDGTVIHKMTLESNPTKPRPELGGKSYYDITGGKYNFKKYVEVCKGEILPGFQLRYIKFLKDGVQNRLTVPIIPYSAINERGAGMYLGKPKCASSVEASTISVQEMRGGSSPTDALHSNDQTT